MTCHQIIIAVTCHQIIIAIIMQDVGERKCDRAKLYCELNKVKLELAEQTKKHTKMRKRNEREKYKNTVANKERLPEMRVT